MNTGGGAKPTTVKPSQAAAQIVLPTLIIITYLEERSEKGHPAGCHQDLGEISEVGPQWRQYHRVRPGKAKVHRTLSQAEAGSRESKSGTFPCLRYRVGECEADE